MSNFICNECGAIYIDNGAKGYSTNKAETTAELIKSLQEKIKLQQKMYENINCLLNEQEEVNQNLKAELENAYMRLNAAITANSGIQILNKKYELQNEIYLKALTEISSTSQCVVSLDDTCYPQREAMRALAAASKVKR